MFGWLGRIKPKADHSADAWVIRCTACGHAAPARERGVYRAWAASRGKMIRAWCTACNRRTTARLIKDRALADELREIEPG